MARRTCNAPECHRPVEGHGWCVKHLRRVQKYGTPDGGRWHIGEHAARFAGRYVVDANGCWIWQGEITANGYGRFSVGSRNLLAHRWAYEQARGPIGDGLTIDHLCRVKSCVNPDHLEPVTIRDNILRCPDAPAAINAAKTECIHGHAFDSANTYVHPRTGVRQCRACKRERAAARRLRRAESLA